MRPRRYLDALPRSYARKVRPSPGDDLAAAARAVLTAPPESAEELAARLWLRSALRRYEKAPGA